MWGLYLHKTVVTSNDLYQPFQDGDPSLFIVCVWCVICCGNFWGDVSDTCSNWFLARKRSCALLGICNCWFHLREHVYAYLVFGYRWIPFTCTSYCIFRHWLPLVPGRTRRSVTNSAEGISTLTTASKRRQGDQWPLGLTYTRSIRTTRFTCIYHTIHLW